MASTSNGLPLTANHQGEQYDSPCQLKKLQKGKSGREFYEICRVCGDGHARMHYGVLTCFGCKGFFRRTLKRTSEYSCRHQGNCIVDKHERNSCRFCRFKRCLEVGMDPKAVRPDRDATGRHYQTKVRRLKFTSDDESSDEAIITEDWSRKLSVEMRTILMQLMNIEIMVNRGDTNQKAVDLYPLPFNSIQQILNNPSLLNGKRTEVRYEPYRQVENNELVAVAHRRLIVTIDWVNHLFDMMDLTGFEDKIALIRNGFAPLMIFSFAAATAKTTKEKDIICLCSSGYVPRNVHSIFNKPYHLANRIIERTIDELTQPFRNLNFTEEEIVLMKAIIILNPHVKGLSSDATDQVADLRDRIQEVLYHVVRETHPKEVASSRFGNLLLFLPTIMILGNIMCENIQLMQSFERKDADQMLLDLFETEAVPTHEIRKPIDPCCSSESIEFRTSMAYNYGYIEPSSSSSSISSMLSGSSYDKCQEQTHSSDAEFYGEFLPQLSSFDQRRYMDSTNSLHDMLSECITESDPDYNTTLTPDTFNEMQQAHTGINVIDIDYHGTPPNSPEFSLVQFSRPEFYIDEHINVSTIEAIGNRHKFIVTTQNLAEDSEECKNEEGSSMFNGRKSSQRSMASFYNHENGTINEIFPSPTTEDCIFNNFFNPTCKQRYMGFLTHPQESSEGTASQYETIDEAVRNGYFNRHQINEQQILYGTPNHPNASEEHNISR